MSTTTTTTTTTTSSSSFSTFLESTDDKVLFTRMKSYYYYVLCNSYEIYNEESRFSSTLSSTYDKLVKLHERLTPDDQKIFLLPLLDLRWREQEETSINIMEGTLILERNKIKN